MDNKIYKAVNWNTLDNDYVEAFWEQNLRQFWIDTEYIPSKDIDSWHSLSPEMREAYKKVLGGLTLLDTLQSHTGMPKIIDHIDSLQCRSVLSYMCMMETIHAKSYSTIFTTVASTEEINEILKDKTLSEYEFDVEFISTDTMSIAEGEDKFKVITVMYFKLTEYIPDEE